MEILVNQEPLEFTLESENVLGEVIDGIADWLKKGQFAITAIDVDDRSLPIHDRAEWQGVDVTTVARLSVEAFPLNQVEQITLGAIRDYCVLLGRTLENRAVDSMNDLAAELPYVRVRLGEFFPGLNTDDQEFLANADLDQGRIPSADAAEQISRQLESISTIIDSRLREYENPVRELGLTLGQLAASVESLTDVPIMLQTGEPNAAMAIVVQLTELLSRLIRLLPLVEAEDQPVYDTDRIGRFALDLTPVLKQLQEAFEVRDTVLIGDLLEYEVAPRLADLPDLVPNPEE